MKGSTPWKNPFCKGYLTTGCPTQQYGKYSGGKYKSQKSVILQRPQSQISGLNVKKNKIEVIPLPISVSMSEVSALLYPPQTTFCMMTEPLQPHFWLKKDDFNIKDCCQWTPLIGNNCWTNFESLVNLKELYTIFGLLYDNKFCDVQI